MQQVFFGAHYEKVFWIFFLPFGRLDGTSFAGGLANTRWLSLVDGIIHHLAWFGSLDTCLFGI